MGCLLYGITQKLHPTILHGVHGQAQVCPLPVVEKHERQEAVGGFPEVALVQDTLL